MTASDLGRAARLDRLAGPTGQIAGVAIDHRDSLRATIARAGIAERSDAELAAFKATVVGLLAPHATAILIDAELGGDAIASGALGGRPFVMPLEAQGYEEVTAGRTTTLLVDFTPATAARAGADACKLLLPYRADHGESADRQDAVVAGVVADCHAAGLPLVLEPIPYALAGEDTAAFTGGYAAHVVASVERLRPLGADVLKLPFPRSPEGQAASWCERIDAGCAETPWVLLGGGGSADDLVRQVEIACGAGASGFIVGRTVWQDAIHPDPERSARLVAERSIPLVERLAAIARRLGQPVRARVAAPPSPPGWWRDPRGSGGSTLSPQLYVRRGRAAVEFYERAFGAVEVYRVGGTDDHEEVVAQLAVGDASFWVADESPAHGNSSPESLGGSTARLLLVVPDPDAVVRRAVALGAAEVAPVAAEHGWLLGRIADPFGHRWEIGKPLGDWPPAGSGA